MSRPVLHAWILLMALSLGSTLASLVEGGVALGLVILAIAMLKARVILLQYLDLARAPEWRAAATAVPVVFTLLLAALYVLPALAD